MKYEGIREEEDDGSNSIGIDNKYERAHPICHGCFSQNFNPMVQPSIVTIAMKGTTSSSSTALTHILEWLSLSLSLTHIYGDFYNVGIGRET